MKMLRFIVGLSILPVLWASSLHAIPVGRGEVTLSANASATYDSNLEGRSNGTEDYFGTFAPRVSYVRRAGRIEANADVGVSIVRYLDNTEYDAENVSGNVSIQLSQKSFQNITASLNAGYVESYDMDPDVNARIKSTSTTFSGQLGLVTGPRTSFDFNGSYSNSKNDTTLASDQEILTGGGEFSYRDFLEGTTLILSYNYTSARSSGDNILGADLDQTSHHYSLGLSRPLYREVTGRINYGYRALDRSAAETTAGVTEDGGTVLSASIDGPFLPPRLFPKIKSHFSIAYSDATSPGINDPGSKQLTGDLSLSWEARETTTVSIGVDRTQRLAVTDVGVVTTTAYATLTQKLRYNLSGSAGANYSWNTYRSIGRSDKTFSGDVGLNYDFARSWTATSSYRYQSTASDLPFADYVRHLAILSLGYTF